MKKKVITNKLKYDFTKEKLVFLTILLLGILFFAAFAKSIVPYDPYAQDLSIALLSPDKNHLFGTDQYGRDLFSRLIIGAQVSIFSTLALVLFISILGTIIGVLCGFIGGRPDSFMMRITDVFLAFPGMVFAIAVAGILGGGVKNAVLALAVVSWPKYARIARGQVLSILSMPYIFAARLSGCRTLKILYSHIIPNILSPVLVTATLDIGTMMIELSSLSFLGLGAQPPVAEWGSMMSSGRNMLQTSPWVVFAPGFAIFVTVVIFNLLGDTLRDFWDPRRKQAHKQKLQEKNMLKVKISYSTILSLLTALFILSGCTSPDSSAKETETNTIFNYGTTAYGPEMGNTGLNPHDNYSGWSAVRYGVGETLFKFNENMELEPWLAAGYEQLDEYTIKINLRDDVNFSSGRKMDGEAVKECLDHLIEVHDRAPFDLKIKTITADGQSIVIKSKEPTPAILNYLSDPYGAIIDMKYGVTENKNVAGTGPFIAWEITDDNIKLRKNKDYWGGEVKTDEVNITAITDGDTLTMALQSGQIDATQGLPYSSISLFKNKDKYKISSTNTSRVFFGAMNFNSAVIQDTNVRKAICMSIDKEGFTSVLLKGNGTPASGAFPSNFAFGNETVTAPDYNLAAAKELLSKSGWNDTDGDGYVDKKGQKLVIKWLTYPGRQELPLLAESVQSTLKEIGIEVVVNSTPNHLDILSTGDWDIYASAFVTAPTGDPAYFFTTHCLKDSAKNRGDYYNENLEILASQLTSDIDKNTRFETAIKMQQILLDDCSFVFVSHLKMSFVMNKNISGFNAHPSDYYEITSDLDVENSLN